jgi:hypothetical protein
MTEGEKKTEQIILRVEKDVYAFYQSEAKRRRVSISLVIRELIYADLEKRGVKNGEL